MAVLDSFVEVYITRQTAQIDTASFNIPLILSSHSAFPERYRTYSDIEGVAEDFAITDKAYIMANAVFSQQLRPVTLAIGRVQQNYITGVVDTATATTAYKITVNGTDYTYTSDADPTLAEIVNGLKTAVAAEPKIRFTVVDATLGTFKIDLVDQAAVVTATGSTLTPVTATETYPEALNAVEAVYDSWYALVADTHTAANIEALASAIQSREKIYLASSSDAAILDALSTTDVGYVLHNAQYDRTALIYHTKAGIEFPEAAWLWQLQEVPGSNTWALKNLVGISADALSSSNITVLEAKKVNYYRNVAGTNIIMNGCMASGEFIDTLVFLDWVKARLQEAIFFRMINTKKIPLTSLAA